MLKLLDGPALDLDGVEGIIRGIEKASTESHLALLSKLASKVKAEAPVLSRAFESDPKLTAPSSDFDSANNNIAWADFSATDAWGLEAL
ncbi:MAG: hypothetical protein TREMPRED_005809 [Tremellales sp. Tagirdzhanova-0007]|nr:MAG: hypothetical protein TREMPRED_005809 [Tremellales sp. Tagirdzhanova-0007]